MAKWQVRNPKRPTVFEKCALSTVVNVNNVPQINKSGAARVWTILFIIYDINRKGTQSRRLTWPRVDSSRHDLTWPGHSMRQALNWNIAQHFYYLHTFAFTFTLPFFLPKVALVVDCCVLRVSLANSEPSGSCGICGSSIGNSASKKGSQIKSSKCWLSFVALLWTWSIQNNSSWEQ